MCVDLSPERLDLARGQGATDCWQADEHTVQRVLDATGGFGADYTFEATGLVSVMAQAVEAARMGWGLCTVAGVAGKGETLDVIPRLLITGRRICGSSFGGVKGRDQVPGLIERYLRGEIARRVNLKFAPEIRFRADERFDEAERIEKLLRTPVVQRDLGPRKNDDE